MAIDLVSSTDSHQATWDAVGTNVRAQVNTRAFVATNLKTKPTSVLPVIRAQSQEAPIQWSEP